MGITNVSIVIKMKNYIWLSSQTCQVLITLHVKNQFLVVLLDSVWQSGQVLFVHFKFEYSLIMAEGDEEYEELLDACIMI